VDAFVNYGKILLAHYAEKVPIWVTFNEPLLYAFNFQGVDNVVHAHAQMYHFYHDVLKGTGRIGIKFNDNFGVPKNPHNASHVEAANRFQEMQLGFFANPIFLGKQYPESVLKTMPGARPLSQKELKYMKGTSDFFGIDPYTATVVSPADEGIKACSKNHSAANSLFPFCVIQETKNSFGWNIGYRSESYVYITPTYFREYLFYLWNTFKTPVFVSEFGFPVYGEANKELSDQLFDSPRSVYYASFMQEILKSIYEDGVHVMGALAWSFMDNWEFGDYAAQFGIQKVCLSSLVFFLFPVPATLLPWVTHVTNKSPTNVVPGESNDTAKILQEEFLRSCGLCQDPPTLQLRMKWILSLDSQVDVQRITISYEFERYPSSY
jgi:beta-glucosidase/6-phospho-beta-glucosidase/beta-galactosidase